MSLSNIIIYKHKKILPCNIMLNTDVLSLIQEYWGEKCHTCLCCIDFMHMKKCGKWYYCSNECYAFI